MKTISQAIARRKENEKQERRERILSAAKSVFLKKGYLGATMRDIALQAELSPGLIYHYFDNKDHVYGQICEEAFHILLSILRKTESAGKPPLMKMELIARAYLRFYLEYPEYFEIISFKELGFKQVGLRGEIVERLNRLSLEAINLLHEIVVEGIADQSLVPQRDTWATTLSLWAAIEGIIFIHKRGYMEMFGLDIRQQLEHQISILLDGIRR